MKYYAIAELDMTDDRGWAREYVENVTPMVERRGGRFLARTDTIQLVEGERAVPQRAAHTRGGQAGVLRVAPIRRGNDGVGRHEGWRLGNSRRTRLRTRNRESVGRAASSDATRAH